jgi:very-short-patch-repair endonuclease
MRAKGANPEMVLAEIAARQHGVVSRTQLLRAGIGEAGVSRRVQKGHLHRVHRGIYAVGHRGLSQEGRWMAAVLACGGGAVLSHRSAAELWELLDPADRWVDVSVPTMSGRKSRAGIRVYRRASLLPALTTLRKSIPVTTPAQTIADLKRVTPAALLRRAIRQAEVRGLHTGIDEKGERTRSELEYLFLRLCRRHQLPMPEVNVRIGPYEVDFLWPQQRVIVETDGYRFHRGAQAFEDDHERDLRLRAQGYDVLRLSYKQVTESPRPTISVVRLALLTGASSSFKQE